MRIPLALAITLGVLVSFSKADSDGNSNDGTVPLSVLEALGLSDLVQEPAEPVIDLTDPAPETPPPVTEAGDRKEADDAKTKQLAAKQRADAKRKAAARRKAEAERKAKDEQLAEARRQATQSLFSKATARLDAANRELESANSQFDQLSSDLQRAEQDLLEMQHATATAEQRLAQATEQAKTLSAAGTMMTTAFTTQENLIAQLSSIRDELKKVAKAFEDPGVTNVHSQVDRMIEEKQTARTELQQQLADKHAQFEQAKQTLYTVHHDVEQKRLALASATEHVRDLTAARQSVEERLRLATIAADEAQAELGTIQSTARQVSLPQGPQTDD